MDKGARDQLVQDVILLTPDNFTPLSRTPWAGSTIVKKYKDKELGVPLPEKVGESWEFSCDPSFPSLVLGDDLTLAELMAMYPKEVLSPAQLAKGKGCEILVKLLDADDVLSVQVHPDDTSSYLKENECGKPESWLVLGVKQGAGIYLGFKQPLSKSEFKRILYEDPQSIADLLQFVEVQSGDYFEIDPGVPHAVGPGVTLLEPQRVIPGMTGKTYRVYDWNRRYDPQGRRDNRAGKPRELHPDASLQLIDPAVQAGPAFVDGLRRQPEKENGQGFVRVSYPMNAHYQTHLLNLQEGTQLSCGVDNGYAVVIVLAGCVTAGSKLLRTGQPALIPHAARSVGFSTHEFSQLAVVVPEGANLRF